MQNAVNWFEIPAADFERAVTFYSTILGQPMRKDTFMGVPHGFFPADEAGVGGAVVFSPQAQPSDKGALVYLNAGGELDEMVSRAEAAGGKVAVTKTAIGQQGHFAVLIDTEGNRIGLHQPI
jgi:uncharacterized protein